MSKYHVLFGKILPPLDNPKFTSWSALAMTGHISTNLSLSSSPTLYNEDIRYSTSRLWPAALFIFVARLSSNSFIRRPHHVFSRLNLRHLTRVIFDTLFFIIIIIWHRWWFRHFVFLFYSSWHLTSMTHCHHVLWFCPRHLQDPSTSADMTGSSHRLQQFNITIARESSQLCWSTHNCAAKQLIFRLAKMSSGKLSRSVIMLFQLLFKVQAHRHHASSSSSRDPAWPSATSFFFFIAPAHLPFCSRPPAAKFFSPHWEVVFLTHVWGYNPSFESTAAAFRYINSATIHLCKFNSHFLSFPDIY